MGATRLQKCGNELEAKKAMVSPSSDQLKLLKEVEQEDNVESLLGELDPVGLSTLSFESLFKCCHFFYDPYLRYV